MSGSTRQASFKNQAISCSVPAVIASAATMLAAIAAGAAPPRRLSEATPGIAELSFFGATISKSNLGGYGPDSGEENLRFEGVGQTASGFSIDLVVTALDGYEPYNTERNIVNGVFGRESPSLKHHTHTSLRLSRPFRRTQRSTFWRSARRRCSSASRRRAAAATASRSTPSPSSSTTWTTAAPSCASGYASATTRRTPPRRRSTRPWRRSSRSASSTTAAPSSTQRRRAWAATTRRTRTT